MLQISRPNNCNMEKNFERKFVYIIYKIETRNANKHIQTVSQCSDTLVAGTILGERVNPL